jgi:hypothetical protein
MATQNPQNPQNPQNQLSSQDQEFREQVRYLDQQAVSMKNLLSLRKELKKVAKEENIYNSLSTKLTAEQTQKARDYAKVTSQIERLEKDIQKVKAKGTVAGDRTAKTLERQLRGRKALQQDLFKTEGGFVEAQSQAAAKRRGQLEAERNLIKDINKQRGIGSKIMDLFRSKEARQRQIDIARAKAGGGANIPPGGDKPTAGTAGAAGDGGGKSKSVTSFGAQVGVLLATLKKQILTNLAAPLAQVSGLVSGGIGGGYGVGGGAISGGGATSILGGLGDIASKIPFIGGILGGLINGFKAIADLVLGLDQGITNFARNLGISKTQAKAIKEEFRAIARASNNIVVNDTRLMESQAELTKALGVRSRFSNDILQNNIKLKEIAGLELETRKAIAQTSITTGRNSEQLTKSILAQSKAFEFETGVAFEFRDVLNQAGKQAGVLGLSFTKFPEKLTKSLMVTKALGFELKQLDTIANSFLDFETSISKEFEAQVLTGKQLNLTRAREAALNNDLVTLAKEINSQIGKSDDFLRMNRIQQDAIAEAVGMTRDGLADALKQQEYYRRLGATNLKQAQQELAILKERGYTEREINKMIGEDAYNFITQTSTAERLTEMMNRIKTVFIEFVEKSGILDFITNPQKIQGFVTGMINRLAGAVEIIGSIIATILDGIASLPFTNTAKWRGLASSVRSGTSEFAGGMRGASATVQGMNVGEASVPISTTVQRGARQQNYTTQGTEAMATTNTPAVGSGMAYAGKGAGDVYLDGQKVGSILFNKVANQIPGKNKT